MQIIMEFDEHSKIEERARLYDWFNARYPKFRLRLDNGGGKFRLYAEDVPPTTLAVMWIQAEAFIDGVRAAQQAPEPPVVSVQECDGCDGTGLMEGWNHRDGNSCPKCKGVGVLPA